jgi:hypothetical protein
MDTHAKEFLATIFEDKQANEVIDMRALLFKNGKSVQDTQAFYKTTEECLEFVKQWSALGWDIYCGIAPRIENRNGPQRGTKEDIQSVSWLWADIDADNPAADAYLTLPPTLVINSGKGRHVYWKLNRRVPGEFIVEAINLMIGIFGADKGAKDYSRILRVPGTLNHKRDESSPVEPIYKLSHLNVSYDPDDVLAFLRVLNCEIRQAKVSGASTSKTVGDYIKTNLRYPKVEKGKSRSELDWHVIWSLVDPRTTGIKEGCSDEFIHTLFDNLPIGKRDDKNKPGSYLDKVTIPKVRAKVSEAKDDLDSLFTEKPEGLLWNGEPVASFYLVPKAILRTEDGAEDMLICDVATQHRTFANQAFPRTAFTSVKAMNSSEVLPGMACVWHDPRDMVVRQYMTHVWNKVVDQKLPERLGTPIAGRHGDLWITPDQIIGPDGPISEDEAPLVYMPGVLDAPAVTYDFSKDEKTVAEVIEAVAKYLPQMNLPTVIWPAIGWFAGCAFKPIIEEQGANWPTLMCYGDAQSGKSSLIDKTLMRLFGYLNPQPILSSSVTAWATIASLAGTNSIPVVLDEYRKSDMDERTHNKLLADIRAAYDRFDVRRGNRDRSVTHYPLLAPICLVGEDSPDDKATRDRLVVIHPVEVDILEKNKFGQPTQANQAYKQLRKFALHLFAGEYIKFSLRASSLMRVHDVISLAFDMADSAFPMNIGERLRNNIAVCTVGILMFNIFLRECGCQHYDVNVEFVRKVFTPAVREIVDIETGYKKSPVDQMMMDMMNQISLGLANGEFIYDMDTYPGLVVFNPPSVYSWWEKFLAQRRKSPTFSQRVMGNQIGERTVEEGTDEEGKPLPARPGQIFRKLPSKRLNGKVTHMVALDLALAMENGLQIPEPIKPPLKDVVDLTQAVTYYKAG